jgi:two-component system, NarL family, sensor kinase
VRVTLDLADIRLPEHVELALYRIAQEALQNVAKHAAARAAGLLFTVEPDTATLCVIDDGIGFDPSTRPLGSESYGLASMAWRAELVGGDLTVASRPGRGTTVTARVPAASRRSDLP